MLRKQSVLLLFVLLPALLLALVVGCDAPSENEDNVQDLREWSLDPDVPRAERVRVLREMLANEDEDIRVRYTAAQMLGHLQGVGQLTESEGAEVRELMMTELGGGPGEAPKASESERMRMECVIALGQFAIPEVYRKTFELLYVNRREVSAIVRRMFVQSFENISVDDLTHERIALLADHAYILRDVMVTARDGGEDQSVVYRALVELRRICNRPDLDISDDEEWKVVIEDLRLGVRADNENGAN